MTFAKSIILIKVPTFMCKAMDNARTCWATERAACREEDAQRVGWPAGGPAQLWLSSGPQGSWEVTSECPGGGSVPPFGLRKLPAEPRWG